jgi:RNA polymerase sigma factor (sigma-70 family)
MSDPAVMHGVLRHLRRTERRRLYHLLGDRELLGRFLVDHDEAAFEEIVTRHGPMVRAVCRRVLGSTADADDAFQAAFLVMIRKARSIRKGDLLAGWLCAVAYRTARQALRRRSRIAARERSTDNVPEPVRHDEPPRDWLPLFDAALQRLPAKYRDPVVLCELQGISRRDASVRLGLTEGTLSSRLGRARDLLRRKLSRHGFPLALGSTLAPVVVPEALTASTAAAAIHNSAASVSAIVLTEGVLATMFAAKLKVGALAGTAVLVIGVMAGLQLTGPVRGAGDQPGKERPAAKEAAKEPAPAPTKPARLAPEYEKFQGVWYLAAANDGKRMGVPEFEIDFEWKFAGTQLSTGGEIKDDAAEEFIVDAKANPATIDFTLTQFDPSKTGKLNRQSLQGIYRFQPDGRLTIAYRTKAPGMARPTRFATALNAGVTILILERDEPKKIEPPLVATPDLDRFAPIGPPAPVADTPKEAKADPAKNADLGKVVGAWELVDVDGQTPEAAAAKLGTADARTSARWQTLRRLQLLPANGPRDLINSPGNTSYVAYADLDGTRTPKWFTLHATETKQATGPGGPAGFSNSAVRLCGIYKLDGEKLIVCLPEAEGSPLLRPAEFKGDGEGGVYLLTFQRAAKNWKADAPPTLTRPAVDADVGLPPPAETGVPQGFTGVPPTGLPLPPQGIGLPMPNVAGPVAPAVPGLPPAVSTAPPSVLLPEPVRSENIPPAADQPSPRTTEAKAVDIDRLQGTWVLTQLDGKPVQSGQKPDTIEFLKDRVLSSEGSHGRFRIDESKSPRQIAMTMARPDDNPMVGIYKIEGDRLFIACSSKSIKLVPTDFEADDDVRVTVYERPKVAAPPAPRTEPTPKAPRERDLQKEVDQLREQLKRLENELKERK